MQEISLARQLIIQYKHFILNPVRIKAIQSTVPKSWEHPPRDGPALALLAERARVRSLMISRKDTRITNYRSMGELRLTLDHLLSALQDNAASDIRDLVYTILGLVSDADELRATIDYSGPAVGVCCDAVEFMREFFFQVSY